MFPKYSVKPKYIRSGHTANSYSGPYYYAYFRFAGKLRCVYLGKERPADSDSVIAAAIERLSVKAPTLFDGIPSASSAEPGQGVAKMDMQALTEANGFVAFVERWQLEPGRGREVARKRVFNLATAKGRSAEEATALHEGWRLYRKCFRLVPKSGCAGPASAESPVCND